MLQRSDPRKLSEQFGIESLSDAELIALLLRHGTRKESVYELSRKITPLVTSAMQNDSASPTIVSQLSAVSDIGTIQKSVLMATIELVRRARQITKPAPLSTPELLALRFSDLQKKKQEHLYGVYFDSQLQIKKVVLLAKGSTDLVLAEPRDLLYYAIKYRTRKIAMVHNHPSGNCNPSNEDISLTNRVKTACELLSLELIDHIILAAGGYYSFTAGNKAP